jgi:putative ABC transport system permease protein
MLSLHRTLSPRYLWRRRSRALLVVLSIALGVAALVATRSLSQSMTKAAREALNPLAGAIGDLLVTNGELGVPRELIADLKANPVPGIQAVRPLILHRVVLPDLGNRAALLVGVELESPESAPTAAADNPWGVEYQMVTRPLALPRGFPAFVGAALAAELPGGIAEFKVRCEGQVKPLSGFGTVRVRDAASPAAALGGNILFLRLADAAKVIGRPDLVTRIELALDPKADREQVRRLAQERIGSRAMVETPQSNESSVNDLMAGVELGVLIGGACALVVGMFLVYNALSVTVAERRHDIGILRSLGATRGQIAGVFTLEACFLGLAGSALGVPLGWGMAFLAAGPIQGIVGDIFVEVEAVRWPPLGLDLILLAMGAGTATALLAALVPARQAASEEPADAVRRAPRRLGWVFPAVHVVVSVLIEVTGFGLFYFRAFLPARVGTFGAPVVMLLGMLVATPLIAAVVARLIQPLGRFCLGVPERLAADNLARSPGRTGLVIAALAAGVALMVQTSGVMRSSENTILDWMDHSLAADLFVSANAPVTASQSLTMSEDVGKLLESLPQVRKAVPVRFQRVAFRDKMVALLALDAVKMGDPERLQRATPGTELFPRLREPATALISDNFAALYHVRVGDHITVRGPRRPVELTVIGTLVDYTWNRGTVFIDRSQYVGEFDDPGVDVFDVFLQPGQSPEEVKTTIDLRWGAPESLVVLTRDALRSEIRRMIRNLLAIGYAQEVVVGIVAGLGVVTALLISVLQRRRELGLLRAVGASRLQVLRSVLAEATLMGAIGAAIGLVFGIPMEWYIVRVLLFNEAGFLLPMTIPWLEAGVVVGLALLIATLAGLGPALHAVRLRITDAVAYE